MWEHFISPQRGSTEDLENFIATNLSDEDIEAWHNGELTYNTEGMSQALNKYGLEIEIWGSRIRPEPLTIKIKD
jgi:hypothetical protein